MQNPRLVALSGPLSGRAFPLPDGELRIGRHSSNDLQIREVSVSRHHCVLAWQGEDAVLRDLDSRHGTFVNGLPVHERTLAPGDTLGVGDSLLLFLAGEAGADGEVQLDEAATVAETLLRLAPEEALYARPQAVRAALPPDSRIARDLQALVEIGAALHSLRETGPLARRLLHLVLDAVPAERAELLLLDKAGEPASAFALDRRRGTVAPFPVSRTVVEAVRRERASLLANDVLRGGGVGGAESLRSERIQSLLCAPLAAPAGSGGISGVLYLDVREPGARFDSGHLELVTAAAGIGAAALASVREREELKEERQRLEGSLGRDLVGESPRLREVLRLLARVAPSPSTVLLRGESGTGKELAARALHRGSPRSNGPFVAINCATLSETLLESELFGHEKGAFTGAVARKPGKLEVADGGTVFLDEIGEIPLPLQAKLLRVLQERELERLGGTRPIPVDVRVIAATHRDLERALREGTFREDLYYRLNVISITLPALRERREDIPLLASHFAAQSSRRLGRRIAGLTPEARTCLLRYDWPGNVRELANAIERAVVLGEGDLIRPEDLPEPVLETAPAAGSAPVGRYHEVLNEQKKRLILDAIEQAGGSISRAAELLGLHPNYLHRLLRNLDLRSRLGG